MRGSPTRSRAYGGGVPARPKAGRCTRSCTHRRRRSGCALRFCAAVTSNPVGDLDSRATAPSHSRRTRPGQTTGSGIGDDRLDAAACSAGYPDPAQEWQQLRSSDPCARTLLVRIVASPSLRCPRLSSRDRGWLSNDIWHCFPTTPAVDSAALPRLPSSAYGCDPAATGVTERRDDSSGVQVPRSPPKLRRRPSTIAAPSRLTILPQACLLR